MRRLFAPVAVVLLAALALTGCVAIKSESASPRAPGVVTITVSVCASKRVSGSACIPKPADGLSVNTAEGDDGSDAEPIDGLPPQTAQLLIGFRLPDGAGAPDEFRSDDGEVFDKSPSYTAALTADRAPPAGMHWEGYISSPVILNGDTSLARFSPEFSLPPGANGAPFAGPFQWRVIAGARLVGGDAGAPVFCGPHEDCYDSPQAGDLFTQISTNVSDFRVLPGSGATAAPGQAATVSFPVRYRDGAGFGPQTLALSATSGLPGNPRPSVPASLAIASGATPSVSATVTVPPGTAPGTYPVTLTAADGAPAVTRAGTATITVIDKTAPTISIGSPTDGEVLTQGQQIASTYSCADEANGSGLASCAGPVASGAPLDTATTGQKTFTVTATDKAGNSASLTRTYTVNPRVIPSPPRVNVTVTFLFKASRTSTKFTRLKVQGVPKGATVAVTCQGSGCPKHRVKGKRKALSFTKKKASGTITLKPWIRKPLKVGTTLVVTVTKPGAIGMVKTVRIQRSKPPKVTTTCLAAGSKKKIRCG